MKTDRLEQAIHYAVATTAAPDDARLAAILARLEQAPITRPAPRRNVWPWLLLAAAGAAAAGGGYWYVQRKPEPTRPAGADTETITPNTHRPTTISPPPHPAPPENHSGSSERPRNSAIIYRR